MQAQPQSFIDLPLLLNKKAIKQELQPFLNQQRKFNISKLIQGLNQDQNLKGAVVQVYSKIVDPKTTASVKKKKQKALATTIQALFKEKIKSKTKIQDADTIFQSQIGDRIQQIAQSAQEVVNVGKFRKQVKKLDKISKQYRDQQRKLNKLMMAAVAVEDKDLQQYQEMMQQSKKSLKKKTQKLDQQYKSTLSDLVEMKGELSHNTQIVKALDNLQQKLILNQIQFQDIAPIIYDQSGAFQSMNRQQQQRPLQKYRYGSKKPFKKLRGSRQSNWQQFTLQPQVTMLPSKAPNFVSRALQSAGQRSDLFSSLNNKFDMTFRDIAQKQEMSIAQLLVNKQYWSTHSPPQGFTWDRDRQQIVIQPKNQNLQALMPGGIMYKKVPTIKQMNSQITFLNKSHKTALQSKQSWDSDVIAMLDGAKALGFNPHFGAISKNSPSLYIGAFVDPLTGYIRTPPKPQLKNFNPMDRDSILQYKVLKAMYTWNSNVRALEQMKKFMGQTQRGWKTVLKNKRKNANILQRTRQQYKSIARKIALGQPIYGYGPNSQNYQNLAAVWQDSESTQTQLVKALNEFLYEAKEEYKDSSNVKLQKFLNGEGKVPLGDMARFKATSTFNQRPYINAQNWLNRSMIVNVPLGKTGKFVQQQSILNNIAKKEMKNSIKAIKNYNTANAFNTLQNLRKDQNYNKFALQTIFHTSNNPKLKRLMDEVQPQKLVRQTRKTWKTYGQQDLNNNRDFTILGPKIRGDTLEKHKRRQQNLRQLIRTVKASQQPKTLNYEQSEQYEDTYKRIQKQIRNGYEGNRYPQGAIRQLLGFSPSQLYETFKNSSEEVLQDSQFYKELERLVFRKYYTNKVQTRGSKKKRPIQLGRMVIDQVMQEGNMDEQDREKIQQAAQLQQTKRQLQQAQRRFQQAQLRKGKKN